MLLTVYVSSQLTIAATLSFGPCVMSTGEVALLCEAKKEAERVKQSRPSALSGSLGWLC